MKKLTSTLAVALFFSSIYSFAQIQVSGKVEDSQGRLPQAKILTNDNKTFVLTDNQGNFNIALPEGSASIIITYEGYSDKTIDIDTAANPKIADLGVIILENREKTKSIEGVIITSAYKPSQARALNIKKNSETISDVLASDAIGKLPDRNAAEAIQRLPAVTIERDMGEGRFAAVRGTPIQWSSSTLNGNRMPSASGDNANRGLQMDIFPSELIQFVKLSKTLTPDMDGDAIGGTIDFITKTAVNKETLSVNLAGGFVNQTKSPSYNASVVYGNKITDKLRFITSAVIWNRETGIDNFQMVYDFNNKDKLKSFAINQLQLRDYVAERRTLGFNGALDYQINKNNKLYFKGLYSQYLDQQTVRESYFNFNTKNVQLQARHADYITDLYSFDLGGEHKLSDRLKLDWSLVKSRSNFEFNSPKNLGKDERGYPIVAFRQNMTYGNLSNDGLKYLAMDSPDGTGDAADIVLPHNLESLDPSKLSLYQTIISRNKNSERDYRAQVNFSYKLNDKINLKAGGKIVDKDKSFASSIYVWMPSKLLGIPGAAPLVYLNQLRTEGFPYNGGFLNPLDQPYNNVLINQITNGQIDQMYTPEFMASNSMLNVQGANTASNLAASYSGKENVYAAYLMGNFRLTERFTVIGGFRNEYNVTNFKGNSVVIKGATATAEPVERENRYNAFLPMVNMRYNLDDNTIVRASYTRSFARPDFGDLNPGLQINDALQTITEGNAGLKPTYANSFDLMFERYFSNLGIISVGSFYKGLGNIIYQDQTVEQRNGVNYLKTSPGNLEKGWLFGLEANFSKRFTELPGFLQHLGFEGNYTFVDSKTEIPVYNGTAVEKIGTTLPKQAKHIFNASIFFETDKFMIRFAGNYKGKYLNTIRSLAGPEHYQWFDKNFTLDASASYAISKRIRLFAELNNLFNEPNRFYHGEQARTESVSYTGFRGQMGVSLNF
ncbi:TonB-dependent receptor [Chryseobacterium ginsenosidimutans]|uniref:TonB-dependent receptor n=1 Tax=Chryseobacterium ginsenosidimutans TaxID=687846 RepID=UPI00278A23BE|nr:TonB-dependent receptor [Chryseobacterium ginsenosidimutans]MDQ0595201.1 TonB-dependent receptor [Chryseobacterium ginsenosidimutans]